MEVLFFGGPILTMSKENENPEAVFVKNGEIAFIGDLETAKSFCNSSCSKIDLKGKCLMPAFIDSHSHFMKFASSLRFISLKETTCLGDIIEKLEHYKENHKLKNADWIVGFGYDDKKLDEACHPNKYTLDTVSCTNPILISHVSGHMGVANSMALQLANITANSKNPKGGTYGREQDGNTPNGYLEESAFLHVSTLVPLPNEEEYLNLITKAQNIYASYGITTIQDGFLKEDEAQILTVAGKKGKLFLDIIGYADINSPEVVEKFPDYVGQYHHHFKIGGYKVLLDGNLQAKTAWLTAPYQGDEKSSYLGYPIYTDEQVRQFVTNTKTEGLQLLAHCNGDAATQQFILAHEKQHGNRNVIIHAPMLRTDQLLDMNHAGIMPSYFIAHTYYWGDSNFHNIGKRRALKICPTGSTAKLGIPFTLHQDTPVLPPDMIEAIWCATNRITSSGKQLEGQETISTIQALKAVTVNGAYQYFEEHQKGSIEVGKTADFIILSENPLHKPKSKLKQIHVMSTFKNGEQVYFR